jgi:hypothetical protein
MKNLNRYFIHGNMPKIVMEILVNYEEALDIFIFQFYHTFVISTKMK